MRLNKILYITLPLAILILIIYYFFVTPKISISIEDNKIEVSHINISIPVELYSLKDAAYHVYISSRKNKEQNFFQQTFVILLKRKQKYNFNYKLPRDVFKNKNLITTNMIIQEVFPGKRKYVKKLTIQLPQEKIVAKLPEIIPVQPPSQLNKQDVRIKVKEKPDFELMLDSDTYKPEYTYEEKIKISFSLKNKSISTYIEPIINVFLKNEQDIIVSSETTNFKIQPAEIKQNIIEIDIPKIIPAGVYFVEIHAITKDVQKTIQSDKFHIVDLPPKIVLPETPVIKYKFTNTILAEVEDDRETTEVKIVEIVDEKKKIQTEHPMILIAGNKKVGLYSFTTSKILKKDSYIFYIQARDIVGNTSKTKVFNVKITK